MMSDPLDKVGLYIGIVAVIIYIVCAGGLTIWKMAYSPEMPWGFVAVAPLLVLACLLMFTLFVAMDKFYD